MYPFFDTHCRTIKVHPGDLNACMCALVCVMESYLWAVHGFVCVCVCVCVCMFSIKKICLSFLFSLLVCNVDTKLEFTFPCCGSHKNFSHHFIIPCKGNASLIMALKIFRPNILQMDSCC